MKKILITFVFVAALMPLISHAQQNQSGKQQTTGNTEASSEFTKRQEANHMVPEALRNEYDQLMTKMANGTLTVNESQRLEQVAKQHNAYSEYFYRNMDLPSYTNYYPMMGRMYYGDTMAVYPFVSHHNSSFLQGLYGMWSLGGGDIFSTMIFFTLVIILIVLLTKLYFRSQKLHRDDRSKALQILEEKYVHGEIEQEEFMTKRKDLKQ